MRILILVAAAAALYGQTGPIVPLTAPTPPGITGGLAATVGGAGSATYYYWVVARYTGGNSAPAGPIAATLAPGTLSGGNFVRLTWVAAPGANDYEILRTTSTATPGPTCTCLLATNQTGTSYSDTGSALSAYTVTTAGASAADIWLDNLSVTPPVLQQTIDGVTTPIGSGGGGGSIAIESDGAAVGTKPTLNWVPGLGLINTLAVVGEKIQIQQAVDTATVQSRANAQSGATLICTSAGASTSAYTCAMSPTLTAYTTGMVVNWKPDVSSAAGAITLNVDTLGAKGIKQADGTTDPGASGAVAGRLYPLFYDGTNFRMPASGATPGGVSGNLQYNNAGALAGIANSSSPNAGEILLGTVPNASATRAVFGQGIALSGGSAAGTYHGINHSGGGFTGNWFNYQQGGVNSFRGAAIFAENSPGMVITGSNYPAGGYVVCSNAGNCSNLHMDHLGGMRIAHNAGANFTGGTSVSFPREGGVQLKANPGAKPTCNADARGTQWFTFSGAGVKDAFEVCAKDAADAYAWRVIY